jgi:hypothetical protein
MLGFILEAGVFATWVVSGTLAGWVLILLTIYPSEKLPDLFKCCLAKDHLLGNSLGDNFTFLVATSKVSLPRLGIYNLPSEFFLLLKLITKNKVPLSEPIL